MLVTDHLDAHGDATLRDVIPIAYDLVLGIAGIKDVNKLHVGSNSYKPPVPVPTSGLDFSKLPAHDPDINKR
ncbi:hypothetical protein DPMN_075390 [Dreissena polymorpha]|uniref:Uncharacterized protein n=1 Tax=Dreissena polymorpha TaxID=45954 RepID=A0A9D4BLH3_DREPO|nr:hypothetical protein DPMN_075390 [Dreissena polymorpha]